MKSFIITLCLLPIAVAAQTGLETKNVSNPNVLLDFASGTTKGIILPAVESLPTIPANGTFLFDARPAEKKIKMFENGAWVNLSGIGNTNNLVPYSGTVDNAKQTIIGSKTTKVLDGSGNYVDGIVSGVLVLESPNKAMVLPKVSNPHLTVKSPYPGMMCYDTVRKAVAVFDGSVWNYWK